ncbi:MAG: hypothetical protein H0X24_02470 [Ktedonobacterales bacterium]|nr:hypothetical protein [Ktedonobacterales bacterium]
MERFILLLLLGWLVICFCLTITTSFSQRRRALRGTQAMPQALSGDTAPIVPLVVRARVGRRA